ncbi:MAG TPA: DNA replication/repair protein RecF [Caulobacteraceae bacterium]
MRSRLERISLSDFRSYRQASLTPGGRSCFLFGPNGAGKTNLLEAISLFSPGRGLRAASATEVGRRVAEDAEGAAWAVVLDVCALGEPVRLGVGIDRPGASRRLARRDGESIAVSGLSEYVRPLWLTPAHDRLFLGPAADRRRFLDRLVFAASPGHAASVASYEHAVRERLRLLTSGAAEPAWLDALEARAAAAGAAMIVARTLAAAALVEEIAARADAPFPAAGLSLSGEWVGDDEAALEPRLTQAMAESRRRDAAAGRTLTGPHRTDLAVVMGPGGRPAGDCSTGEQKAMILNLVLAQAARLSRAKDAPNPILLLDEVAAHLDAARRAALFDELEALGLQAFLTGTDEALFETLKGRALAVRVEDSQLIPMEA